MEINEPIAFNMEQEELALHGTHNLYNSLAAGISANLAGIRKEYIRKALSDFKGVEHRLEKVATVRGVSFINDSKATNVNSCWYALQSMTGKTVLILGGKDKGTITRKSKTSYAKSALPWSIWDCTTKSCTPSSTVWDCP